MRKVLSILFILLVCCGYIHAQQVVWDTIYDISNSTLTTYVDEAVLVDSTDFIVCGRTDENPFVMNINEHGGTVWLTKLDSFRGRFSYIEKLADGNFLVSGVHALKDTVDSWGLSISEGLLYKTNRNGDSIWLKKYLFGYDHMFFRDILELPNGDIMVCGSGTDSTSGIGNLVLIRMNSIGDTLWTKKISTTYQNHYNLILTRDTTLIILASAIDEGSNTSGFYSYDSELLHYSLDGENLGHHLVGQDNIRDLGFRVHQCADNGFLIAGYREKQGENGKGLLVKLNENFGIQWRKEIAIATFDNSFSIGECNSIKELQDGSFMITGVNFAKGHTYLTKIDVNGNVLWDTIFQDYISDMYDVFIHAGIAIDKEGSLLLAGNYKNDAYFVKLGGVGLECDFVKGISNQIDADTDFKIYPNPSTGLYNVQVGQHAKPINVVVRNLIGEVLLQKSLVSNSETFDLSGYASGIYFVQLSYNHQVLGTSKIVKQ